MNLRETAYNILLRIEGEDAYADPLIARMTSSPEDARYVRTLVFNVLRWRESLDAIIEKLAGRSLSKIDKQVVMLLRMAIAELRFMSEPPYAVVSQIVSLAAIHAKRGKGFVNAVLRNAANAKFEHLLPRGHDLSAFAIRHGHPPWLAARWSRTFGDERARAIVRADQELSWPDVLVNARRSPFDTVRERLTSRGLEALPSPLLPEAMLRLRTSTAAIAAEIDEGLLYPMDDASAVVAKIASAAGDEVLDLAAAPGGKTLAMTLFGSNVVANDVSLARMLPLARSFPRFFDRNARVVGGDGRTPPFRTRFDAVLLDAPCSASGTIRRNPEVKWRLSEDCFAEFASLQRELLASALGLTRNVCIYSTCSLEPEENDEVVDRVLAARSDDFEKRNAREFAPESVWNWIGNDGVLRLTPDSGGDGFTVTVLARRGVQASWQQKNRDPNRSELR